ncbi:glycosyltransferase family 4 protein [Paramaledivibacter caminithermalis]|jgi:glycosyltransferase involved in cell wall biosynthesis|uniref:Glycosyltransferase involved in cell wall bisynthesis n=1 Tax=Paramaledivibacter caminithermalis (strain DSM 15212 / CIP 107654 / DViRD3) TaxID=1121301 RepID=A0A1M6JUA8_PARC5|nr:glycosyltransferase [Paramaledivibacter caminithermalis]SHJ50202.1 Glycosyltransferase involved in cell wall bisynthesis [Paramaledivibacter caminithermalis DSM 15212]
MVRNDTNKKLGGLSFELEWYCEKKEEKGVNLVTCYKKETGLGEACRLTAKALKTGGINYSLKNSDEWRNELSWVYRDADESTYNVNIFHVNPDHFEGVYNWLGRSFWDKRYSIGYWYWELPDFPDEWTKAFEYVDEVWAASEFTLNSIKVKSPVPVKLIPPCIKVDSISRICRKDFNLPENRFLFLTMYDSWSFKDRKNPQGTIEAFKDAFSPKDTSVGLVIKINNSDSKPDEINKLTESAKGYNNIYFIKKKLERSDVNALINMCDCFVSLHRSEGFGLVLAEAMYLGIPVIGTNWSGNKDFMNYDNSCPVDYELVKLGKDIGPYKAYQIWAEADRDQCAYYMKELISNKDYYDKIAQNGKKTIRRLYSPQRIGKMIRERLESLRLL